MKRSLIIGLVVGALALLPTASAQATSTGTPGQPSQDCEQIFAGSPTLTPTGFNTTGFQQAGTVYAGGPASHSNPNNPQAVSQYDVACFQATNKPAPH